MTKHAVARVQPVSTGNFYGGRYYQVAKGAVRLGKQVGRFVKKVGKKVRTESRKRGGGYKASPARKLITDAGALQAISQHNDWSSRPSRTVLIGRWKSPVKTFGHFHLSHFYSGIIKQVEGRQGIGQGMEIFNLNQCLGVTSNAVNNAGAWGTDPFQLNPYSVAPTTAIYPGIAGVASEDKIFIKDVDHCLRIVSMTTIPQKIKIYWMLCKKNTTTSVAQLWTNLLDDTSLGQGAATAPTTLAGPLTFQPGKGFTNDLGRTPYQVPAFKKFWKLLSRDQMILQPGDEISVKRKFVYNRMLQKGMLEEVSGLYVPGYTVLPFVIVEGSLVGISTALGVEATQVAPGSCKVGIFSKDTINFKATPVNRYSIERNEPAFIRNDTTDVLKQVDDTDDIIAETNV